MVCAGDYNCVKIIIIIISGRLTPDQYKTIKLVLTLAIEV